MGTTDSQVLTNKELVSPIVSGEVSLREGVAPVVTPSQGKLYVKSSDSSLYYLNDAGSEYSLSQSHIPHVVYKPVDEGVANSNTLQDDDHLYFPIEANAKYRFKFKIFTRHTEVGSTNLKIDLTGPAGVIYVKARSEYSGASSEASVFWGHLNALGSGGASLLTNDGNGCVYYAGFTDKVGFIEIEGTIENGPNAGNLQLQFSQNVINAINTVTVERGSFVKYQKI